MLVSFQATEFGDEPNAHHSSLIASQAGIDVIVASEGTTYKDEIQDLRRFRSNQSAASNIDPDDTINQSGATDWQYLERMKNAHLIKRIYPMIECFRGYAKLSFFANITLRNQKSTGRGCSNVPQTAGYHEDIV